MVITGLSAPTPGRSAVRPGKSDVCSRAIPNHRVSAVPESRTPRRLPAPLSRALGCAAILACLGAAPVLAGPSHAIAMHGEPAWPKNFSTLPYANPRAPKGGRLVQGILGTFDTLNPFVVRGLAAQSIRGYVIESLMARGYDEPFTLYGLLAESVETDDERSYVSFTLNPAARFADGRPVTAEDVVFSWQLLRDKGRPNHRTYYAKVRKAEIIGGQTVRFDLSGSQDRELPLILGLMPVLPRHAINPETFEQTTFEPPLGSGPYVVKDVQPGRSLLLSRNPDYWGKDLPINRGFWNFDEVRFDYYRDDNAYFEAFKKGLYDVRAELDPSRWQTGYDFPAVRSGRVIKEGFPTGLPKGLSAFVFNTRRPVFADIRVREAIATLFDSDWVNQNFFFGLYARTASYFEGSELSSVGRPADERERKLLAPFPDAVRPDVMNGTWRPESSDGSGRDRANLKKALALFAAAGFELKKGVLRNRTSGQPLAFEFLVTSKDQERLALAFARDLKRAGITVRVRVVDAVQYDRRRLTYDYDMIQNRWDQSLSPGNEQHFYWSSEAAKVDGTRNYMGARNPAVDAMIAALLRARGRDEFVSAVRALDRALISGFYVVPLFHLPEQWVARWSHIEHPKTTSLFGYLPESWWRKPQTQ
jgi:peptide/nickel transport system substrate-binding protein